MNFGAPDFDYGFPAGDGLPNFYGTSSAAPHAAAVAALLIHAKKKFYNQVLSPAGVRSILQSTALNMEGGGFDYNTGFGLIQANDAMQTFAAATPEIVSLEVPSAITPGTQPFTCLL